MAMTFEDMYLQEVENTLYEIKDAVAAIEFNWAVVKPIEKYVERLDKAKEKARKLNIKTERIDFYVELGKKEAKECLEEQGYL